MLIRSVMIIAVFPPGPKPSTQPRLNQRVCSTSKVLPFFHFSSDKGLIFLGEASMGVKNVKKNILFKKKKFLEKNKNLKKNTY